MLYNDQDIQETILEIKVTINEMKEVPEEEQTVEHRLLLESLEENLALMLKEDNMVVSNEADTYI